MNSRKIFGILLIVGGIALGYMGFNKVADNGASIEILDTEIGVSNESGKTQGYIFLGLAVVLFGGGLYMMKGNK